MRTILFFITIFSLASCGAVHKLKQSQSRKVDSVVNTTRDTTHVSQEENSTSNVSAQDVHVTITYPEGASSNAWSALQRAKAQRADDLEPTTVTPGPAKTVMYCSPPKRTGNKIVDAIGDAIVAAGSSGRLPAKVQIDIGSISDSSGRQVKKDSGTGHSTSQTHVQTEQQAKSKEVARTGMPLSAKIGLWLLILAVIAVVIRGYWTKIKAFFTIIK
jgi:cobalamin biosynthesis Mg chelatase CobN